MGKEIELKNYTTFHIGGRAEAQIIHNREDVAAAFGQETVILGYGSNVLFPDNGITAPVLINRLDTVKIKGSSVYAESGYPLTALSKLCRDSGLSGLEWAYGIPGSIGGAVFMNAGAFGGEISGSLDYADVFDGKYRRYPNAHCGFGYRKSRFMNERCFILGAQFKLEYRPKDEIAAKMDGYLKKRRDTQPKGKCAGSVFKASDGTAAGFYIDRSGLKGTRIGGAIISEKHANFILNEGNASADDVVNLMKHTETKVYDAFGVRLTREIRLIGEFDGIFR